MKLRPPGIRLRLTLWYTTVFLVILGCLSAGIYALVRASLDRALRAQLIRDIDTVATVVAAAPEGKGPYGHLPGDILFAVMENQRVVYHSDGWCRAKWLHDRNLEPLDSPGVWHPTTGAAYERRVSSLWIKGREFNVTVAEDAATRDDTLGTLLGVFLLSSPCAALLSVAGGYFLAGRALSPISAMAAKAGEITAESLSERLPVENPNDELGRMATVFNKTLARLESSFEQLRSFAANVSHELRTPLTAIRSVGEVALKRPLDTQSFRDVIGSMLEETDRLTHLVDSLLNLARAGSQGKNLPREEVDLAAIAKSQLELLRVLAEEKEQSLNLVVRRPALVRADAESLRQALTNLIDNAIRYTPARGHVEVEVGLARDGSALIEVRDDGPGIAPEERGRIFDRFYRVHPDRGLQTRGSGLGLSIARGSVEASGGRISYECAAGGGSTFRITFPPGQTRAM